MLNLYSQMTLPVSDSRHITRSWSVGPLPDGFCTHTRLPITIGAERPPYGARQRKFWPLSAHFSGRPVSAETPSRLGPRASGQSPTGTRRGPCPDTVPAMTTRAAMMTQHFLSMGRPQIFSSKRHSRADPEGARCPGLADKSRRRETEARKRCQDVERIEGVTYPSFREHVLSACTRAEVGERISALPGRIRVIVLVLAVADDLGASIDARGGADGPRVLDGRVGGVVGCIGQLVPADV